jgi:hypothetical protein
MALHRARPQTRARAASHSRQQPDSQPPRRSARSSGGSPSRLPRPRWAYSGGVDKGTRALSLPAPTWGVDDTAQHRRGADDTAPARPDSERPAPPCLSTSQLLRACPSPSAALGPTPSHCLRWSPGLPAGTPARPLDSWKTTGLRVCGSTASTQCPHPARRARPGSRAQRARTGLVDSDGRRLARSHLAFSAALRRGAPLAKAARSGRPGPTRARASPGGGGAPVSTSRSGP